MTTKKTSDELLKEWHIVRKEERRIKKCKKFCRRQAVKEVLLDEKKPKEKIKKDCANLIKTCLLYTSPSPRDRTRSRMPSSA